MGGYESSQLAAVVYLTEVLGAQSKKKDCRAASVREPSQTPLQASGETCNVAGWDHPFDVDERDRALALDCFRILRRSCARFRVEFGYYRDRTHRGRRLRYILWYNLQSSNLALAVGEFAIEMRAVSTIQRVPRRKALPLRLVRDVAWSAVDVPVEDQLLEEGLVPDEAVPDIARLLIDYKIAYAAWSYRTISAAEFLEAQHSLLTSLALRLVPGVDVRDDFPTLVNKLYGSHVLKDDVLELGRVRNEVKHRGRRDLAERRIDDTTETTWRAVAATTGAYPDPVGPEILRITDDWQAIHAAPPMFRRSGEPRRMGRW